MDHRIVSSGHEGTVETIETRATFIKTRDGQRVVLFHDQTEETDGDRARQREGWPAGKKDVPRTARTAHAMRERGGATAS